jgi:oxygen-independent coproporphyrinogen-3 oxidase
MTVTPASRPDCLELLLKYDKPVPRYTSFPTAAAFHDGVGPDDLAAQLARPTKAPLSLYVHLPFCRHACWYCGCSRITTQAGSKVVLPYLEALAKELALVARASGSKRSLAQLHWGGGTPNYLTTAEMAQLWGQIERNFDLDRDLEASIELNAGAAAAARSHRPVLLRLPAGAVAAAAQDRRR